MDRILIVEWLVAEGIVAYNDVHKNHHIPMPGRLLATSGVFLLLALFAEAGPGASKLASTLGGGFVIAAGFGIFQKLGSQGPSTPAPAAKQVTA